MDELDPYRILQVLPTADRAEIRDAYRRLARRFHPDHATSVDDAARMIEVNRAWELLGNEARRAEYDEAHGITRSAPDPAPSPSRPTAGSPESAAGAGLRREAPRPAWGVGASPRGGSPRDSAATRLQGKGSSVLTFGRYSGMSLDQIARRDRGYLEWLVRTPIGRSYRTEVARLLGAADSGAPAEPAAKKSGWLRFRR